MVIGGIAYLAAKMPSKKDAKGYQSVARYPCSDLVIEDCDEAALSDENYVVKS